VRVNGAGDDDDAAPRKEQQQTRATRRRERRTHVPVESNTLLDYSVSKDAIHAFTKSLAQRLMERGNRVRPTCNSRRT
jgi:NAD(P)-dependent dehydrogenase (short-subunit alcohol dehydrogenase family)